MRVVPKESYGAALMYFTGSKAHNIALRSIANEHGWKLNEYGLFDGSRRIAGATEEEIDEKLGLMHCATGADAKSRETALLKKSLCPHPYPCPDIRGDLHVHSDWSDGTASISDMVAAARNRGYAYIALTDHSQRLTVAHGLDAAKLSRQIDEIDKLNGKLNGITVLKGMEVDILADGDLDMANDVLSRLDIVVAAIDYKFDLSRDKQNRTHHSCHG